MKEAVVQRRSIKKAFLKILQTSQENNCARVSFLIKLQPATLLKKRLWDWCFSVNFAKYSRIPFFYGTPPVAASNLMEMLIYIKCFEQPSKKFDWWKECGISYINRTSILSFIPQGKIWILLKIFKNWLRNRFLKVIRDRFFR